MIRFGAPKKEVIYTTFAFPLQIDFVVLLIVFDN